MVIGCFTFESGLKITWILVNLHGTFLLTKKLESREKGIKYFCYRGASPTTHYVKLGQKLRRGQWYKHRLIHWSLLSDIWWLLKEPFLLVESDWPRVTQTLDWAEHLAGLVPLFLHWCACQLSHWLKQEFWKSLSFLAHLGWVVEVQQWNLMFEVWLKSLQPF